MEAAIIAQTVGQAAGSMAVPAIEGGKGVFNCLKRRYGYVKHIKNNFEKLKREEEYLCDEEERVETEVNRNEPKMKPTRGYQTWLSDVKEMKEKIKLLEIKYAKIGQCLCGLCPIHRLLKYGERIVKMTEDVVSLRNKIGQITIMVEKPPDPFIRKHALNIGEVPSLYKHVEILKEYLENDTLKKIRIWGPPGVGKTTIMENVHNAVGESGKYNMIFWVTVNINGNIRDIQEILLKQLKLNVEEHTSNYHKAEIISRALEDKRYVLFLDGVSSDIDLREIGIHKEHERGKVVFTCRIRNCCGETDEDVNVQRLSDEDAQKIFWDKVGVHLKNNRDIKLVAGRIINECGGMPHMIKLIGTDLAKVSNPAIWRAKLDELRSPSTNRKQKLDPFYKAFKSIYEQLDSYIQPYLLYWAIFPAGYQLHQNYIIECWRADQFFTQLQKLREARDQGHAILDKFVERCLLVNGEKRAHYKMFEHFHRAALRIAKCDENSCRILVKDSEKISKEEWKNANRLSLIRLCLSTLPKRPKCCRILTLLLQESSLSEIPELFFGYMCGLQLLDLHDTNIRLLPPSISSLINLKALFLNNCRQLMLLPTEIGDLNKLEIFDLRQTGIQSLPTQIGQLTSLKCLRVSFVEHVGSHNHVNSRPGEMISSNIISRLHSLEELIIDVLDPTNGRWKQNVETIVKEAVALEELTTLCFYFPKVEWFQTFISSSKSLNGNNSFRSFSILVGYQQRSNPVTEVDISGCSAEKHFRFSAGVGIPSEVSTILEQACSFELIGHQDATNLSVFGPDKLGGLEACIIEDCNTMTSIIDGNCTGGVAFQSLNELHIKNLPRLVHIWEGSIGSESLNNLTILTMKKCHTVQTLFSKEMVVQLNQLQYLQVEDCRVIEEIIKAGSVVDSEAFPKLKSLELIALPSLSTICDNVSLAWPSLEKIAIKTCGELKSFPSTFKNVTKLGVIACVQTWLDQLDWQNDTVLRDRFQRLHQPI
ncbi:Disease resistance protein [Melia azedarach]|uniref:Disease resistance protein n=1 Tax=Melia azedarach TaxID=155640 RepID=A0ACC1YJG9_MELAZ|nr:Disease resistance protein [Melia azedarach]